MKSAIQHFYTFVLRQAQQQSVEVRSVTTHRNEVTELVEVMQ